MNLYVRVFAILISCLFVTPLIAEQVLADNQKIIKTQSTTTNSDCE